MLYLTDCNRPVKINFIHFDIEEEWNEIYEKGTRKYIKLTGDL